jgi:Flp pilus assembly pilin Flp
VRNFARDEKGSTALLFGVIATVLLGCGALAIDVPNAYRVQARLQTAADAAATAAVLDLPNATTATAKALDLAAKNAPADFGTITTASDVIFGTYDSRDEDLFGFLLQRQRDPGVRPPHRGQRERGSNLSGQSSRAIIGRHRRERDGCADHPPPPASSRLRQTGNAFSAGGSGKISVPNCAIHVNSSASNAYSVGGNSTVAAKSICVVGGASGGGTTTTPKTGCAATADPLIAMPEPTAGTCLATGYNNQGMSVTINPGTYCGDLDITGGTVTMNPGVYHFKNSRVSVGSSASLVGSGVMLFLDATSELSHTATGTLNLSAPTSGTYAGIAIFQSRNSANKTTKLTGSPNYTLDGTIYMPTASLVLGGNGTITNNASSGYVIARTFSYNGSVTFTFDAFTGLTAKGLSNAAVLIN